AHLTPPARPHLKTTRPRTQPAASRLPPHDAERSAPPELRGGDTPIHGGRYRSLTRRRLYGASAMRLTGAGNLPVMVSRHRSGSTAGTASSSQLVDGGASQLLPHPSRGMTAP